MQLARVLSHPVAYRLWQWPFARAKLEPLLRHNDLLRVRSVLDVGCGPGTNADQFSHIDYTGVDLDASYIEYARSRHPGRFICADASCLRFDADQRHDLVLLNSLLHHLDDQRARDLLAQLREAVAPGGHLHVIELVLPERRGLARLLASMDRGRFPRPLDAWRGLLTEHYRSEVFEPFTVQMAGVGLWNLVYFKGEPIR